MIINSSGEASGEGAGSINSIHNPAINKVEWAHAGPQHDQEYGEDSHRSDHKPRIRRKDSPKRVLALTGALAMRPLAQNKDILPRPAK